MREPADQESGLTVRGYWMALRDGHLEGFRERAEQELAKEPDIPDGLEFIRIWWNELDSVRQFGMDGPVPIDYVQLDAWARMTEREPTPEEVRVILLVDRTVLNPGKRQEHGQ